MISSGAMVRRSTVLPRHPCWPPAAASPSLRWSPHLLQIRRQRFPARQVRCQRLLPQPLVRPPVHPLRPLRQGLHHTPRPTEPLPELLRLPERPVPPAFPLALIGEIVAVPAEEVLA